MINNINSSINTPDLSSVLQSVQNNTLSKLNCMRIGLINKIISETEILCSITNKMLMGTNKDGTGVWQEFPLIYCHVWYMGSEETGINHVLNIGGPVLMLFNDREIDSFFETGEISTLASTRVHSLNDCIAIPLYQPQKATKGMEINAKSSIDVNTNQMTINASGGVYIDAPDVVVTGNLKAGTGISAMVPCGVTTLIFSNGILTGVK